MCVLKECCGEAQCLSVCLVGFNLEGVLGKSLVNHLLMGDCPFLKVWG